MFATETIRATSLVFALCFLSLPSSPSFAETLYFPSVEALSHYLPPDREDLSAELSGYSARGDAGGGTFDWMPSSDDVPDGVFVFEPARREKGRWIRRWSGGRIPPEIAGALGDGKSDDSPAFSRLIALSKARGAFTIELGIGRRYYFANTLDLSTGAPGLTVEGPASPRTHTDPFLDNSRVTRLELNAPAGATIKMGEAQSLRNVLVWRHGLTEAPASLPQVRKEVSTWYDENGTNRPLSLGVSIPFDDVTIDGVAVYGFHTGIRASGGRFKIRHSYIDAAGCAIEVSNSKDTSIIEDVQTRALWSNAAPGRDEFGDHSYRPGTAFYVHDGADGLQLNSVMAIGWVNGIWLAGSPSKNDWLISLFQPNIETPANDGKMTAAIKTTGEIRRITIVDPRLVAGGLGDGPAAALDFGHSALSPQESANNNVTVIGGTLEMANTKGNAVILRTGTTGTMIGTTLNLTSSAYSGPLVRVDENVGRWDLLSLRPSGSVGRQWITIHPSSSDNINIFDLSSARSAHPSLRTTGGR
jgi:hypothetical protein